TWRKEHWGVFHSPLSPEEDAVALAFMKTALERAGRFRNLLVAAKVAYPPLHVIRGSTTPTLHEILRRPDGSLDFESGEKCPGDGRVCAEDTVPPGGVPAQIH